MKLQKGTNEVIGLTGFSIGSGIIGNALGSSALVGAGETASKFISPAVNISMSGAVIGQLKSFRKI